MTCANRDSQMLAAKHETLYIYTLITMLLITYNGITCQLLAPAIDVGYGRALKRQHFATFPAPKELELINTEPAKQLRQALLDAQQLVPAAVSEFARRLVRAAAAHGHAGSKWQALQVHSAQLLPYLRARPTLSPLLSLLRQYGSGALKGKALDRKLGEAVGKLDPTDFHTWVVSLQAAKHWQIPWSPGVKGRLANTDTGRTVEARGAGATAVGAGSAGGAAAARAPDLNDPVQQLLEFGQRLKTFNQTFGSFWQYGVYGRKEPANPKNPYLNVGLPTFKPRRIGLVFHVFLFRDDYGYAYPPGVYQSGQASAQHLVDIANRYYRYSGANIQFYIREYRGNGNKWPYLLLPNLAAYQGCAARLSACTCNLARRHSYKPEKHINIFVIGDPNAFYGLDRLAIPGGLSTAMPPFYDQCNPVPGAKGKPPSYLYSPTSTPKSQHLWLQWPMLDPLQYNNYNNNNEGSVTLAHELGHMLGLWHTQMDATQRSTTCDPINDGVADTPVERGDAAANWYGNAEQWCNNVLRGSGNTVLAANLKALAKFNSCPNRYMDNAFNIMSYSPTTCNYYFTRGQVARMQGVLGKSQARLGLP